MAEITLYGAPLSPFVLKVMRGLGRKGIGYELTEPGTPLDLRRWNPVTHKMPVADIRGERVYDSTRILRRLDELFPEVPLVADDPAMAAGQHLLEDWADESLYWHVMAMRWNPGHVDATLDQILGGVPSLVRPLVKPIAKRGFASGPWHQGLGRLPEDVLLIEFGRLLDHLEGLRAGRPFFFDDRPSVADLAVYGQLVLARNEVTPELGQAIERRPGLIDYMKGVEQATGG